MPTLQPIRIVTSVGSISTVKSALVHYVITSCLYARAGYLAQRMTAYLYTEIDGKNWIEILCAKQSSVRDSPSFLKVLLHELCSTVLRVCLMISLQPLSYAANFQIREDKPSFVPVLLLAALPFHKDARILLQHLFLQNPVCGF